MLFPLLALDLGIAAVLIPYARNLPLPSLGFRDDTGRILLGIGAIALACLVADYFIIRCVWRAVNKTPDGSPASFDPVSAGAGRQSTPLHAQGLSRMATLGASLFTLACFVILGTGIVSHELSRRQRADQEFAATSRILVSGDPDASWVLEKYVSSSSPKDTQVRIRKTTAGDFVEITATARTPQSAANMANTLASATTDQLKAQFSDKPEVSVSFLETAKPAPGMAASVVGQPYFCGCNVMCGALGPLGNDIVHPWPHPKKHQRRASEGGHPAVQNQR